MSRPLTLWEMMDFINREGWPKVFDLVREQLAPHMQYDPAPVTEDDLTQGEEDAR